jgi:hypothetical protein
MLASPKLYLGIFFQIYECPSPKHTQKGFVRMVPKKVFFSFPFEEKTENEIVNKIL